MHVIVEACINLYQLDPSGSSLPCTHEEIVASVQLQLTVLQEGVLIEGSRLRDCNATSTGKGKFVKIFCLPISKKLHCSVL